ncbi:MAG: hypothetical protein QNJ62_09115 [Methyloceanibacter sp.]|nr:hypothetical protein [Methyloceanibacter sp.]
MISSRDALSSLEQALRGLRRDEDNLSGVLRNASEELSVLRTGQAETFRALARVRLNALKQGNVVDQIDAAEAKALDLMRQWQERVDQAMADRKTLEGQIAEVEDERLAKVDEVDSAMEAIEDLKEAAEPEIEANDAWKAQRSKLASATAIAQAANDKAATAEADLDDKGKPYKADPLFMYLWNAKYGTSGYKAGGLTRFFDRRIARLIGFEKARQDYYMLTEIPKRFRQHAEHVAEKAESEDAALEEIERGLLKARGITELETRLETLHGALTDAEGRLDRLRSAFEQRAQKDKVLLDPQRDPTHRDAVEMLAKAIEREDLDQLWRDAKQTPTAKDESLVGQLNENLDRIRNVESQVTETRQAIVKLAERRAELERSRDRFYRSGFDNPIGGFSNGDEIGEVIGGILKGALESGALDDLFNVGYRQRRRPRRGNIGGGFRLPSGGKWTAGGTIGGGRGGRSRPGGFRTTGGF